MTRFMKTSIRLWLVFLVIATMGLCTREYRYGLEINAPLITPTNPELR